jgi:hypothetical protein
MISTRIGLCWLAGRPGSVALPGFCIAAALALVGCAPTYYAPPVQPTFRFEQTGDVQVAGHFWITHLSQRAHVQAGIVPWKRLMVTGSTGGASHYFDVRDSSWRSVVSYTEIGPGTFWMLGNGWVGSIQGFYGFGSSSIIGSLENKGITRLEVASHRLTVQPALSWSDDESEIAASVRLSPLFFHDVRGEFGARGVLASDHLHEHRRLVLWEPAVTFRRGYGRIIGEFQIGHSSNLAGVGFLQEKVWFSAGFGYRHRVSTR